MIVRPVLCSDVVDLFSYFRGPFFLHAPSGPYFLVDVFTVDLFSVDLFFRTPFSTVPRFASRSSYTRACSKQATW